MRELARRAVENTQSMGVAQTSGTLPSTGKPMFSLGEDEMEVGIGVHSKRGIQRTRLSSAEVARILLDRISLDLGLKRGDNIALLVNRIGSASLMELLILSRKTVQLLDEMGVSVIMSSAGNLVTSLDVAGASLTLVRLDDELRLMLAAPDTTPSFPKII